MSALTPHIAVLRAEAEALNHQSAHRHDESARIKSVEGLAISVILIDLASAKTRAADKLEAEEREREAALIGAPAGSAVLHVERRIGGETTEFMCGDCNFHCETEAEWTAHLATAHGIVR